AFLGSERVGLPGVAPAKSVGDADLVVVGPHVRDVHTLASAHPDAHFVLVGRSFRRAGAARDNIAGLLFRTDQAAYLAGVVAALASTEGGALDARVAWVGTERHRIAAALADPPILELRNITKQFPGVLANDRVGFDLRQGEVHALLGENGAGKSTLMNILYGLYTPDDGEILLHGKPIELGSTKAAIEHGIGMVHQHFMLIPVMTVAENIVLAAEPRTRGVLLDYGAARRRVEDLSRTFKFAID